MRARPAPPLLDHRTNIRTAGRASLLRARPADSFSPHPNTATQAKTHSGGPASAAVFGLPSSAMTDPDELLRKGLASHQAARLDEARTIYEEVLKLRPNDPNAMNLLGMVHHAQGRHQQAEDLIRAAIKIAPTIPGFHNNLANTLLAQRRVDLAEESYRDAIKLQPDYAEAHNNLGVVLFGQGKLVEAIEQLVKTINLKPDYPSARNNLGNALRARYMFREAIQAYTDAIALKPDYFESRANMATTLLAMGNPADAINACAEALAMRPDDASVHLTKARALEKLGREEEAIACYREALRLKPNARSVRFALAAMTGEKKFAAAPPEFVRSLFDDYAETFDKHLIEKLGYRGPELVLEAAKAAGVKHADHAIDLGCGTGLCGKLLRPMTTRLVGVDLSPRMIGQAREREVYDELFVDELTAFLSVRFGQFDLAVAADVLIYLGDLKPVLTAAARALKPGGVISFTLEKFDGDGFVLNKTCRYAHSLSYVRALFDEVGLKEVWHADRVLRMEHRQEVAGCAIAARRS